MKLDPNQLFLFPGFGLEVLKDYRRSWIWRWQRRLLRKLLKTGRATAGVAYPGYRSPPGIDPRCHGAVTGPLVRLGIIESLGYTKSTRPGRRRVQVWQLLNRAAALRWLESQ